MVPRNVEGDLYHLATDGPRRRTDHSAEQGVVLRPNEHFDDAADDRRKVAPPEFEEVDPQGKGSDEGRQVSRYEPLVDGPSCLDADAIHPIILPDEQEGQLGAILRACEEP